MTREWTFPLPYPRPPLTLNQRLHWAPKARLAAELKDYGTAYTRKHKIPRLDRYTFVLHWAPRQVRNRDGDNLIPTLKHLVDGYCRATGAADTADHYTLTAPIIHASTGEPGRLWVVIIDLAGDTPT